MAAAIETGSDEAPVDTPFRWRATGLPADGRVTVRAEAAIGASRWRSEATFLSSSEGVVDPEVQAPVDGSYDSIDPAGLLWSMSHVEGRVDFPGRTVDPVEVDLTVSLEEREVARRQVRRLVLDQGVARRPVDTNGLVGAFFAPRQGGPHPGVLIVGGSEGGLVEGFAAALARHGFATMAVAYFGVPGLRSKLVEIPVEYFRRALDWLKAQPETSPGRPAVIGSSKGGEAALLVAATYDDVGAVVGVVPSGVAFMGIGRSPLAQRHSSWTIGGKPVPFVPSRYSRRTIRMFASLRPIRLRVFYEEAMANASAMDAADFHLERIRGPVLLLSGRDDQLWPSAELAQRAVEHLNRAGHAWPVEHIAYPNCGHAVSLPYTPAVTEVPRAFAGRTLVLGGTRAGAAAAAVDGSRRVIEFLHRHLET